MAELSRYQKRLITQEYSRFEALQTRMGREMADCLDDALIDAILDLSRVAKGWPDRSVPASQRLGVKTFTGLTTLPGEYPK